MNKYTPYEVVAECRFNKSIEWCKYSDVGKLIAESKTIDEDNIRLEKQWQEDQVEIDELKALVIVLKRWMESFEHEKPKDVPKGLTPMFYHTLSYEGDLDIAVRFHKALNESPSQSLATIKRDAILEMYEDLKLIFNSCRCPMRIEEYANNLTEQDNES